ncbi:MAG: cytochrome-c oxidase, cbb3-type subunit I [Rhodothalassiaceae bacterium]
MAETRYVPYVAGAAFLLLVIAAVSPDPAFSTHMFIATACVAIGALILLLRYNPIPAGSVKRPVAGAEPYMDGVIRYGAIATVFWGLAGFLVGVVIAFQLAFPELNFEFSYTNFGRLRPLHTSAVIFAFGGNALICSSFYVLQRTCKTRLALGDTAWFVFWGYQLFIVMAATGYLLGITQSKEYAEPEWYVDLWLTVVWVAYLAVFMATLFKRREPHIFVANWFFLAFIITTAMLHLVNNVAIPVSFLSAKSYTAYAGVQDALIQWWYGHNAVGFFLTAGFLGMMYYYMPKQADRPIYSYRLSIIHFWSLIFLYIWAGPHHLHYTALPDWAQTLGMVFSVMLWMPSWGGMINGLMTLQGAWDKLRTDPLIRMMAIATAFYGMSTFEGPVLSIKSVNGLSHYTDWTIGHVHSGALGWNGMITFAAIYFMVPKLWGRSGLYSLKAVNWHFWLATIGIVIYAASMWVAGITQGLMWREYDDQGFLVNSFVETVSALHPYYLMRAFGGVLYLAGAIIMAWNIYKTIRGDVPAAERGGAKAAPTTLPAE